MGAKSTDTRVAGSPAGGMQAVGRIGKLFGTDGGVTLSLYDTFPGDIDTEEPLWVVVDSLAVPLFAERFERRGRSGALVLFADIDTPERASEMIGKEVCLRGENYREKAAGAGELYLEDLAGFAAVVREEGSGSELRGEVTAFIDNEFNPLFEVLVDGKEILVPASDEFIEEMDEDKKQVMFNLPAGLLGLNT